MLIVMGGGTLIELPLLAWLSRDCTNARAAQRPDADEICRATVSHWRGSWHSLWSGGSSSRSAGMTASNASVERGGFGATGFHFFSMGS